MKIRKEKHRIIYLPEYYEYDLKMTVARVFEHFYCVIGNGGTFEIKNLKKDWGKEARWGKYIKL